MNFNFLKSKIFLSFLLGGVILVLSLGIYFTFFRPFKKRLPSNQNQAETLIINKTLPSPEIENINQAWASNKNAALPQISEIAEGGDTLAKAISQEEKENILSATIASNKNGLILYDKEKGKFFQSDFEGNIIREIVDRKFPEAENVEFSPVHNQAIIEFPDNTKIFYDFDTQRQVTLPKEMENIKFSPQGDQIGFKFMASDPDRRFLGVAKPDGSEIRGIELLGENAHRVEVNWSPTGQVMATYQEPSSAQGSEIFFIGLHGENFLSLEVPGRGFQSKWSPDGSKLLFSVYNLDSEYRPILYVTEGSLYKIGQNTTSLKLNTWADKCAFASKTIAYCAVPQKMEKGAGIFPELNDGIPDTFYQINLYTGQISLLANPVTEQGVNNFTVVNPFVSPDGKFLYFTDKNTGKLLKIKLKP